MTDDLDAFFDPGNVAIIGASRDGDKIGHTIMRNFVENRFFGKIYPVNPNADEIMGYSCFDTVQNIDDDVELAVVSVPATIANDVIQDCVDADVDAVIVITSGYEEIGEDGMDRADELQEMLDGSDTRLLGPNCLGVWDAYSGVDTLFLPSYKLKRPPQGDVAIITQSGAFGSTMMDLLADMSVGVSRFISYGNQADVTERELLQWLQDDDKTDAVAVYMEGVSDGEAFVEQAAQVTDDMPVVTLKSGKHDSGQQAISSHTGSLAGSYNVYRGVFKQTGVVEATTTERLFDYTRALAYNQSLDGDRIAVVTNGGGYGVLTADALEERGLTLASFADDTADALQDIVPSYGNVTNPLDLIGDADADRYDAALEHVIHDDNVDGVIVIPLMQPLPLESDVVDTVINVSEETEKPVVACMTGGQYTELHRKNLEQNGIAAYTAPERAADAMQALYQYGEWTRRDE